MGKIARVSHGQHANNRWRWVGAIAGGLPLIAYGGLHFQRPEVTPQQRDLFQGIRYERRIQPAPQPVVMHIVAVDLAAGVRPFVTPGQSGTPELQARTTRNFVETFGVQVAINGNFFYPFRAETPWDYRPRPGEAVNAVGLGMSNGVRYSAPERSWPALCFDPSHRGAIAPDGDCPAGTQQAIAGDEILLAQGIAPQLEDRTRYARTAAGLNAAGDRLWLVVVDHQQPRYSEGITLADLAQVLKDLGATDALNLDGGGSATLAVATPDGPALLNAPNHTKLPTRERPVANHLGFYAQPHVAHN